MSLLTSILAEDGGQDLGGSIPAEQMTNLEDPMVITQAPQESTQAPQESTLEQEQLTHETQPHHPSAMVLPTLPPAVEKALNRIPFESMLQSVLRDISVNSLTDTNMFQLSLLFPGAWKRALAYMDHVGGDACITEVRDSEKRVLYMVKSPANQEVVHYVTDEFCTCNEWIFARMPEGTHRVKYCVHQIAVLVASAVDAAGPYRLRLLKKHQTQPSTEEESGHDQSPCERMETGRDDSQPEQSKLTPILLRRMHRITLPPLEWSAFFLECTVRHYPIGDPYDST